MNIGIIIGRFQVPFLHEGHKLLIQTALDKSDKVIVLLGSANRAPSPRNPFNFTHRAETISKCFPNSVVCYPLNDYLYSDSQWMTDVALTISKVTKGTDRITLFGHFKEGNDYLTWFPQYKNYNVESDIKIDGTAIRNDNIYLLPNSVQQDIAAYDMEKEHFKDYKYPEALNICCADTVLECAGHVLLIRRKYAPGKGSWALPGGHKNNNETFLDAALRELEEETNVRVPMKILRKSIKNTMLFDNPNRSGGLVRCTLAVHIVIGLDPVSNTLPRANGNDDASETRWVPLNKVLNDYVMFDDHSDIISVMTGTMPTLAVSKMSL